MAKDLTLRGFTRSLESRHPTNFGLQDWMDTAERRLPSPVLFSTVSKKTFESFLEHFLVAMMEYLRAIRESRVTERVFLGKFLEAAATLQILQGAVSEAGVVVSLEELSSALNKKLLVAGLPSTESMLQKFEAGQLEN